MFITDHLNDPIIHGVLRVTSVSSAFKVIFNAEIAELDAEYAGEEFIYKPGVIK